MACDFLCVAAEVEPPADRQRLEDVRVRTSSGGSSGSLLATRYVESAPHSPSSRVSALARRDDVGIASHEVGPNLLVERLLG